MSKDRQLAFSSKIAFGVGQMAEGLKNTAFGLLVLFFYNQVLGLSGTLCGLALFIALLFDAITDPLAGSISDNWKSRLGRRHPFMYAAAPPLALAFFGLFSPPAGLSELQLFGWLIAFAILTRGAMTLYHVPHLALGAELTENFAERTSIVAYRQAFGYVGGMLASGLAFGYFFADANGGRLNLDGYSPYAVVLGGLMVVTIWYSAWGTRREIPHLPGPSTSPQTSVLGRLFSETASAFQNLSFRWLFLGVLIVFMMVGVDGALNLYMYQYFWELNGQQILLLALISPIGLILGSPFTRYLHLRWDKKAGLVFGTAGWAICQITPVGLRLLELLPENGTGSLITTLAVFRFFQGLIVQQALVSFGSMMADVVDEHELASGRRQEGIFFGAVAFSGKAASGLGTFVAGIGLDVISWPRGSDIKTAADVAPETIANLGILFGPIVAGFAVVSVWCYTRYRLTRGKHEEILVALRERRAAASSASTDSGLGGLAPEGDPAAGS
jgi:Na+/melibiose symporter-like transporter